MGDWKYVTKEAKDKKLKNRRSKRDIEREKQIQEMGGEPLSIEYGEELTQTERMARMEVWRDLKYPDRTKVKPKNRVKNKGLSNLTLKEYLQETFSDRRRRALKSGVKFTILLQDIEIVETCPVLGISFTWGGKVTDSTVTFDKIDPDKGYVPGNVVLMSNLANRIKSNATVEQIQKVADWLKLVTR